uniref:Nose resistant-to-fluoxetine protein N-terminal domain-containing protein n=1 Tax=Glossina brevipalpis TaxID=37001 RepID=A0A1A9W6D5_9MUSC
MASKIPRQAACKSRQILGFAVLLVFLTFIHNTDELSFGWGSYGTSGESQDGGGGSVGGNSEGVSKMLMRKRTIEKKFKFHKLERTETEDDDEGDNDNDDDDEENEATTKETNEEDEDNASKANSYDDDNNNDDNDNDDITRKTDRKKKRSKFTYLDKKDEDVGNDDDVDNDDNHEDDEAAYEFRKARKARKVTSLNEGNFKGSTDGKPSKSWLATIFGNFFGGEESKERDDTDDEHDDRSAEESKEQSNSIIDWIMWLSEKFQKETESSAEQDVNNGEESWLDYLNRWPFNSLFPIGKPTKPIKMPKSYSKKHKRIDDREEDDDESGDDDTASQENFESLLQKVPLFMLNPLNIPDSECHQQMQIFHHQLKGHKLWTLQMLDATAKISNGLLRGNINQFGDFSMCTDIKTLVKVTTDQPVRIRGKYCLAHIEVQATASTLRVPVHMLHGRGLFKGHLGNPNHFIPRYGVANVGVCVPNTCTGPVVQEMILSSLEAYNSTGVELHVEVDDSDCYVKHSKSFLKVMKKDKKFCATLLYLLGLGLLLISTMIWEYWSLIKPILDNFMSLLQSLKSLIKSKIQAQQDNEKSNEAIEKEEDEEQTNAPRQDQEVTNIAEEAEAETSNAENPSLYTLALEIFKSFSPKRTLHVLLASDTHDVQFPLFHVLKIGATFMLYLCLKFLMFGHLPITNRDDIVHTFDNPWSILIRNPMIYIDTLLLISGFLSAYQLSEEMEQKSYIQLLKRMSLKVSRYLPTIYMLICFQTWILPYMSSGPMWTNLVEQNARLCEEQWWRNLLSLQNAIDFEETCSPVTVQLALEVQLYLLGPLVVWLYYTDSDAGFFMYGALHAMSVAARYSLTQREHLSMTLFHGINVSKFYRTANNLYASPISRATSYLLGLGAGIFQKTHQGVVELSAELIPVGWTLATLGVLWCFWSPSNGMRTDYIYSSNESASYASWCPLIYGLSLCWFIFMLPKTENSFIKFLTTSQPIVTLSRLVFSIQLITFIVVLYNIGTVKEPIKFHVTDLINPLELIIIFIGALILAFLIDIPSQNIRHLVINRIFLERSLSLHENENEEHDALSGTELSDASEEHSERLTSDSPEPVDFIWGSEAEDDERGFSSRRTNSIDRKDKKENETKKIEKEEIKEEEEEEQEEEEIEEEISEEEEVKKRPESPTAKPEPVEETPYRRRRRLQSDD